LGISWRNKEAFQNPPRRVRAHRQRGFYPVKGNHMGSDLLIAISAY
jgi:hypothetical protein